MKKLEYTNPTTGYRGVMYGKRSFSIYDKNGKVVFHTNDRAIQTYNELVGEVDSFDEFLKILGSISQHKGAN